MRGRRAHRTITSATCSAVYVGPVGSNFSGERDAATSKNSVRVETGQITLT
ncbi:MAG: hypothetical protein HYS69_04725 [candidate division NC10 bacterium]|nr:hypothetical protein [candidate division NC10 bacterium]